MRAPPNNARRSPSGGRAARLRPRARRSEGQKEGVARDASDSDEDWRSRGARRRREARSTIPAIPARRKPPGTSRTFGTFARPQADLRASADFVRGEAARPLLYDSREKFGKRCFANIASERKDTEGEQRSSHYAAFWMHHRACWAGPRGEHRAGEDAKSHKSFEEPRRRAQAVLRNAPPPTSGRLGQRGISRRRRRSARWVWWVWWVLGRWVWKRQGDKAAR